MESSFHETENAHKHFIEKGRCEKLLSFHRKVSLIVGMLISQGPCFERQVVT